MLLYLNIKLFHLSFEHLWLDSGKLSLSLLVLISPDNLISFSFEFRFGLGPFDFRLSLVLWSHQKNSQIICLIFVLLRFWLEFFRQSLLFNCFSNIAWTCCLYLFSSFFVVLAIWSLAVHLECLNFIEVRALITASLFIFIIARDRLRKCLLTLINIALFLFAL